MSNLIWNWRYHAEHAGLTRDNLTRLFEAACADLQTLRFFCYDHAPPVYDQSEHDDWPRLLNRLFEYSRREGLFLSELVKPDAPQAYQQYEQAEAGWNEAAKRYDRALYNHVKNMNVLGKNQPVPLEGSGGIFTDVYLLDEPTAFKRHAFDLNEIPKRLDRLGKSKRRRGFELVTQADSPKLFVLGKPGAGKTTFLKYIALQAIKGRLAKVPFFISLHAWANEGQPELVPYLTARLQEQGLAHAEELLTHWLAQGQALLLFDGLDEIAQEDAQRQQAVEQLKQFARRYYRSQIIISCRIAANQYRFNNFHLVEVADFDDEQIRQFASYWFAEDEATQAAFLEQYFKKQDDRFRELGNIPILLSLLCLGFRGTFPKNRALLYEDALRRLLEEWDESKGVERVEDQIYRKLWPEDKETLFAQLAYEMFNRKQYYIPARQLERWLQQYLQPVVEQRVRGREILRAIVAQHSILVERARGIYSFSHLSFQEYFTARYIVEYTDKETLPQLMAHVNDDRWREIFLLTASLLGNADQFFVLFQQTIEKQTVEVSKLLRLLTWVNQKTDQAAPPRLADVRVGYLGIYLARGRDLG